MRPKNAQPKAIRPFLSTVSQITDLGYDKRIIRNERLKDAVPKANSRGFLNPWN